MRHSSRIPKGGLFGNIIHWIQNCKKLIKFTFFANHKLRIMYRIDPYLCASPEQMSQHASSFISQGECVLKNHSQRELDDGRNKKPIDKLRLLCLARGTSGIFDLGRYIHNSISNQFTYIIIKTRVLVTVAQSFSSHRRRWQQTFVDGQIPYWFENKWNELHRRGNTGVV